jgi:hypothetical protein
VSGSERRATSRIGSLKGILPRRCHRSPLARLRRRPLLARGLFMPQAAPWCELPGQPLFTIVECPRRDCAQRAKAYSYDGPWEPWEGPIPDEYLDVDVP